MQHLFRMDCSRKNLLSTPPRENWIPRLFLVKYCPGLLGEILSWISVRVFWTKILIFTQVSRNDPHIHSKSRLSCFLTLDFWEKVVKVEFQTFCIRSTDILCGGGQNLCWISQWNWNTKRLNWGYKGNLLQLCHTNSI